jgi:hypothetical protein
MVYNDTFNFQQYFSYIAVVNSIDGGNQRKPPTRTQSVSGCGTCTIFQFRNVPLAGRNIMSSYTGIATRVTRRIPYVEQELLILSVHLSLHPVLVGFVLLNR